MLLIYKTFSTVSTRMVCFDTPHAYWIHAQCSGGQVVLELVKKLRSRPQANEGGLIYLLDPVMGDMGRGMYVAPEVLPIYQEMLQYATIITPNQFEAQALTGVDIVDLASLKKVIVTLHRQHKVPHVIITSVELPDEDLEAIGARKTLPDGRPAMLQVVRVAISPLTSTPEKGKNQALPKQTCKFGRSSSRRYKDTSQA